MCDLVVPVPLVMPPIWEITYEINLIDLDIRLVYHLPRCLDMLCPELIEKYTKAPFPDQDVICNDVAQAKFHMKLDMSDTYKQICIKESDMPKTIFATICGTFMSHIMQLLKKYISYTFYFHLRFNTAYIILNIFIQSFLMTPQLMTFITEVWLPFIFHSLLY
jgi:hypothetical protein